MEPPRDSATKLARDPACTVYLQRKSKTYEQPPFMTATGILNIIVIFRKEISNKQITNAFKPPKRTMP
jgi:hypothetical protein